MGFGHSHLHAMLEFDWQRCNAPGGTPSRYTFVQLLAPENQPAMLPDGTLNPVLRDRVDAAHAVDPAQPLFACISGNEYHYVGLVDHPRPFDVLLPERPDLPLRPGVDIIPAGLLRQVLEGQMEGGLQLLAAVRAAFAGPILVVQSPPPVPDNEYIRAHPISFAEQIALHGVAPATLRMKLWLLQSDIYRQACAAAGLAFLPVPAEACDPQGFLLPVGWRDDPVHANPWYGRLVLDQIDRHLATHRSDAA